MFERIVSGGQTGVDRAALDVALAVGIPCGGWCPQGRKAEDGPIAERYPLQETPSDDYEQRTEWNVRDADGTLVVTKGPPVGGTALTIEHAQSLGKPCLVLDLNDRPTATVVRVWALENKVRILNVAGPRESRNPGIYAAATTFFHHLFSADARR